MADDPAAVALFFNIVVDAFTRFLLGCGSEDGGILCDIASYFGCIEEQGRGTLHIHMLLWLKGY